MHPFLSRTPIPSCLLRLLGIGLMLSAIAVPLYLLRAAALEQAATRSGHGTGTETWGEQ